MMESKDLESTVEVIGGGLAPGVSKPALGLILIQN
jgi:hypothetical protein